MRRTIQGFLQLGFLVLFVFLIANGRVQMWLGMFLASVAAALLLGRVYCGWICPIETVMKGITWAKKKLRIGRVAVPAWLTKPWVRIAAFGLFVATFIFSMVSGRKLPALPALFAAGIALTLIYPEELWHRYLCPYGFILSLPARKSKLAMKIDAQACNGCGMCERVCPAKAVVKQQDHHTITKEECLVCMECSAVCRQHAIHYGG